MVREDYERLGPTHWRRETSAAEQEADKFTLRHDIDSFPNCSIESYLDVDGIHTSALLCDRINRFDSERHVDPLYSCMAPDDGTCSHTQLGHEYHYVNITQRQATLHNTVKQCSVSSALDVLTAVGWGQREGGSGYSGQV